MQKIKYSFILLFSILFADKFSAMAAFVGISQADYVIVAHSSFRDQTWETQLLSLKESQGYSVCMLRIYDYTSQKSIRDVLLNAWTASKKIKYVLLVGDANAFAAELMNRYQGYDITKNFVSAKYLNFIPGPSRRAANCDYYDSANILNPYPVGKNVIFGDKRYNENGLITSDDFYGNYEGDFVLPFDYNFNLSINQLPYILPEAVVGRVPVRNITEMRNYVQKLAAYNAALTTPSRANALAFQNRVLGLVDNRVQIWTAPQTVLMPFQGSYRANLPSGVVLNTVQYNGYPNLFGKNNYFYLLTLYNSVDGHVGEMRPFMEYRTKYEPGSPYDYRDHNRGGNPFATPPSADDDIDDYPAITNGSYTMLLAPICDRIDFDGVDRTDRNKIQQLINGTTYYDGYFSNQNDLYEDVLLTPQKGAIAVVGIRYNSFLKSTQDFSERFLNALHGGEPVLGQIVRSAKLYSDALNYEKRSRNTPSSQFGDYIILGDPSLIINTPTKNAPTTDPQGLFVEYKNGKVHAAWQAVSGAVGYAVSVGNMDGMPYWTYFTTSSEIYLQRYFEPRAFFVKGEKCFVNVRPYGLLAGVRTFSRTKGATGSVIIN